MKEDAAVLRQQPKKSETNGKTLRFPEEAEAAAARLPSAVRRETNAMLREAAAAVAAAEAGAAPAAAAEAWCVPLRTSRAGWQTVREQFCSEAPAAAAETRTVPAAAAADNVLSAELGRTAADNIGT